MKKIIVLLSIVLFISCSKKEETPPVQLTKVLMDTYVTLSVYDSDFSESVTTRKIEKAFDKIHSIEKIASAYSDSSKIYYINEHASETLNPEEIISSINNLCFGFFRPFSNLDTSSLVKTVGSFFSSFGVLISARIAFFRMIW